jgi:hypothetical protein
MRYFYHSGYHDVTKFKDLWGDYKMHVYSNNIPDEELTFSNWNTTEGLIEVTEENYKRICKDEELIKEKEKVPYWHRPIASEDIPEGKVLLRSLEMSNEEFLERKERFIRKLLNFN